MHGWAGRLLRIDLTKGRLQAETLSLELARTFLGGRGLAAKLFTDEVKANVEPLGPDNKLVIMAGPLTGTAAPCGCVAAAVSKSPLTGTITCGIIKGHFGAELKHAGYDGLIIEGRARFPVYLALWPDRPRLLPAAQLWGRATASGEEVLRAQLKDPWLARETRVVSIGPAGEKQALMATLVNEDCVAQGGAGLGAVMGSKNLKAIAVRGTQGVSVADGSLLLRAVSALLNKLASAPHTSQALPAHGTPFLLRPLAECGALPASPEGSGGTLEATRGLLARLAAYKTHNRGCFACSVGCRQLTEVREEGFSGRGKGPEYGALAQFGLACGVSHLPALLKANYICTAEGLDPVSAGATIACAMSLQREGRLSKEEVGCELRSGDPESLLAALELLARGEGFGQVLAGGSRRLAKHAGHPRAFRGSKGLELPPYDVRAVQGLGLSLATANFGPSEMSGFTVIDEVLAVHRPADPLGLEGKAALVKLYQDATAALDSMGGCVLSLMGLWLNNLVPVLRAVTGMEASLDDILRVGERVWNLERLFNIRAGINGRTDSLPPAMLAEAAESGPARGRVCELPRMLPEYYGLRGWDGSGVPTAETRARLGLG